MRGCKIAAAEPWATPPRPPVIGAGGQPTKGSGRQKPRRKPLPEGRELFGTAERCAGGLRLLCRLMAELAWHMPDDARTTFIRALEAVAVTDAEWDAAALTLEAFAAHFLPQPR